MKDHPVFRIILLVAILASTIIIGDRSLSFLLEQLVLRSDNRFVQVYEGSLRGQSYAIVLGNSRADRHFPPGMLSRQLEMPVLNLGLGGVSTRLSEILLRDAIEHNGPPALVIIEPTSLMVTPIMAGDLRLFGLFSQRIRKLTCQHSPTLCNASKVFRLIYFNNEMFARVMMDLFRHSGERLHHRIIPDLLLERLRTTPAQPLNMVPENVRALQEILTLCESLGLEVRVIMTPFLVLNEADRRTRRSHAMDVRRVAGEQHVIHDYTTAITDTTKFNDGIHLNAAGVKTLLSRLEADSVLEAN